MRVLITGHRGFVGRHLWAALDTPDNDLYGIDVKPGGRGITNAATGRIHDCREAFRSDWFGTDGFFDLVLHCAAIVGGRATIDGEPMAVATDLAIDSDLFQWALRTRPGRVVYFSSSAAYPVYLQGAPFSFSLREDHIDLDHVEQPDAIYGWVKLTGERLAHHARAEGLNVTVLRPFSGYGHDQDPTYPFPAFIQRALRREDPFTIWGSADQVRDWIHIDDVVGATLAAVDQGVDGPVNLCTGVGTTMRQLADEIFLRADYCERPEITVDESAPLGVMHRVGDPTLMRTIYEPRITLEQGIAMALNAHQEAA